MFEARVARCCEMRCFRRMNERVVRDVRRTSESKKVPQIAAHRGPQPEIGEKGGLGGRTALALHGSCQSGRPEVEPMRHDLLALMRFAHLGLGLSGLSG